MNNAEKLAKDTYYLAAIIQNDVMDCEDCPAMKDCHKMKAEGCRIESCFDFIQWWLEQEVEEDAEIH